MIMGYSKKNKTLLSLKLESEAGNAVQKCLMDMNA